MIKVCWVNRDNSKWEFRYLYQKDRHYSLRIDYVVDEPYNYIAIINVRNWDIYRGINIGPLEPGLLEIAINVIQKKYADFVVELEIE